MRILAIALLLLAGCVHVPYIERFDPAKLAADPDTRQMCDAYYQLRDLDKMSAEAQAQLEAELVSRRAIHPVDVPHLRAGTIRVGMSLCALHAAAGEPGRVYTVTTEHGITQHLSYRRLDATVLLDGGTVVALFQP